MSIRELRREIAALRAEVMRQGEHFASEIQQLRWKAYHDRLTGLPNEASLMEHTLPYKQNGWLVVIDLNDFKWYQDSHPDKHAAGDRVLVQFGNFLKDSVRATDWVACRLHGDEFAVWTDSHKGADRIARLVRAWRLRSKRTGLYVSASAGIGQTLAEADSAMYADKERRQTRR